MASDNLDSSPPELTYHESKHNRPVVITKRSSVVVSCEPSERREIDLQLVSSQKALSEGLQSCQAVGQRPALSPVVRIGRTLQDILSDPPSPFARSSGLGSPFRGSVRNSSPLDGAVAEDALRDETALDGARHIESTNVMAESVPVPSNTAKASPLFFAPTSQSKNLVTHNDQLYNWPHVNTSSQSLEDPCRVSSPAVNAKRIHNSAFMDRIRGASRKGNVHSRMVERTTAPGKAIAVHISRSEATGSCDNDAPRSVAQANDLPSCMDKSEDNAHLSLPRPRAYGDRSFDAPHEETPDDRLADQLFENCLTEDEQLVPGQFAKGIESELIDADSASVSNGDGPLDGMREIQLNLTAIDDIDSDEEDIWAVEANRTASSPQAPTAQDDSPYISRRNDLSVDWGSRSTASQVSKLSGKRSGLRAEHGSRQVSFEDMEDFSLVDLHSGNSSQSSARKPTMQAQPDSERVDLSDFFSSSPNFFERQRRAKKVSLAQSAASSSVSNPHQVLSPKSTRPFQSALPVLKSLDIDQLPTERLPLIPRTRHEPSHISTLSPDFKSPEHRSVEARIPARSSGRVQRYSPDYTLSLGSWPPTQRTPSMELRDALETRNPQQNPMDSNFESSKLRLLSSNGTSPSRSCLRSPLKPKTRGRVVNFTSSTLSMMAQRKDKSYSHQINPDSVTSPEPLQPPSPFCGIEKRRSLLPAISESTQQSQSQQWAHGSTLENLRKENIVLSTVQWSRNHWLHLDELLQLHRHEPFKFQLRCRSAIKASPRKRASSRLLGREATSQGVTMLLEQWHLDIVDMFRQEVGVWGEEELAKRLFALIIGGERRRQGRVP